ncbi:MAG: cell division protein FtsH [Planctomycetaceae bacterium]|nr:cell division protein FtsH [Planctomycetaceae bacterium]
MSSSPNDQGDSKKSPESPQVPGEEQRRSPPVPWFFILMVVFAVFLFVRWLNDPANVGTRVPYSFFLQQLDAKNVTEVKFYGDALTGKWSSIPDPTGNQKYEDKFNTRLPEPATHDADLIDRMVQAGVKDIDDEPIDISPMLQMFVWMMPLLLIVGLVWMMIRRSSDPMGGGMLGNFARSPARRFHPSEQRTTFDDVAAMDQAKSELQEVVEFLKNPPKFQRLGAQIPKGVLLMGPPGTGKTLLARATAGEAGVPFYSINGSEFIQMFVGVGASRVRDLFRTAKDNAPCILFIDEIDAVGRMRGAGLGGGHDEREQTLNQILSEMDGFQQSEAVIVIAATNRPDVLDAALLRPGRFDRHVTIDRPPKEGRAAILKVHCRKVPLGDQLDINDLAASTIGFSGADLRNLVNEAALNATRSDKDCVETEDFEVARDRVLMGPQREEVLNEEEKEKTAYHEAGHALIAWMLPNVDPVHKVTIVPRGRALGVTQLLPEEESYHMGEGKLHDQLVMIMGGRAAEKAVFSEYSAGAEDDLKRATQIARRMVGYWGMSDAIGPVAFRHGEEHPFLGKEIHENKEFSEETAHVIDKEVQRFLSTASERAFKLLNDHRDKLDRIVEALLDKETIDKSGLVELIGEPA